MKLRFLLLLLFIATSSVASAQWISVETDEVGDGVDPSLLDGVLLEYMHDLSKDSLWFRISTSDISDAQSMDVGVNIMVWYPAPSADESLFNFWSPGNSIAWHRLLTVWVTGSSPSNYSGTMGISKGVDVDNFIFNGVVDGLKVIVDREDNFIIVGMNRSDLIPDDQLGQAVELSSAVGSSMAWNDDILTSLVAPIITLMEPNVSSVVPLFKSEDFDVYPNPSSSLITIQSDSELIINSLEFYDLSGRLIQSLALDRVSDVNISKLATGSYIIKAYSDGIFMGGVKLIKTP